MTKDSSKQYLKYLAALSLSVAVPAVAQPAQPQVDVEKNPTLNYRVSNNLESLAATLVEDGLQVRGNGWPECTDVPEVARIPEAKRPTAPSVSLTQLMDDVLKELA